MRPPGEKSYVTMWMNLLKSGQYRSRTYPRRVFAAIITAGKSSLPEKHRERQF